MDISIKQKEVLLDYLNQADLPMHDIWTFRYFTYTFLIHFRIYLEMYDPSYMIEAILAIYDT